MCLADEDRRLKNVEGEETALEDGTGDLPNPKRNGVKMVQMKKATLQFEEASLLNSDATNQNYIQPLVYIERTTSVI
jgi:hypothetical protein